VNEGKTSHSCRRLFLLPSGERSGQIQDNKRSDRVENGGPSARYRGLTHLMVGSVGTDRAAAAGTRTVGGDDARTGFCAGE
jgi:hypothetical protein